MLEVKGQSSRSQLSINEVIRIWVWTDNSASIIHPVSPQLQTNHIHVTEPQKVNSEAGLPWKMFWVNWTADSTSFWGTHMEMMSALLPSIWLFSLAVFGWFDWTAVNRRLPPGSPPAQRCSCWLDTPPQIASSCFSLPRSSLLRPHSPCLRRSSSCHHDAPRGNVAQQAGTCRLGSKT